MVVQVFFLGHDKKNDQGILAATVPCTQAVAAGSPVSKVFEMLAALQAKVIKEGGLADAIVG